MSVAYVLKNFPKISETFIASEIYRLEQLGLDLKLLVIKPPVEAEHHAVIKKIRAVPFNLPAVTSLSETPFIQWLRTHLSLFLPDVVNVFRREPRGALKATLFALTQSIRARRTFFSMPRKVYLKEFLQAASIAKQILNDKKIAHVHAHFAHDATTVAWMAAMITGLQFSFTAHAKDIYLESLNPANLLPRKMNAAKFVVTCTEANRRHLRDLSNTPVYCIYHGLTDDFVDLLRQNSPNGRERNGHIRALAVGRLVEKKGLDTFVDACGILQRRDVRFEAIIVGENGEAKEKIDQAISANNLTDKVRLAGSMKQADLFEEYRRADVFCLPCRILENGDRDGIPNVMIEAMSCGVPVVTTNISGIPEVIEDGRNGLLVEPNDATALANSLERIYRLKSLSARLAAEGLRTVQEKFDGDVSARKLAKLFEREVTNAAG